MHKTFDVKTSARSDMVDITSKVAAIVAESGVSGGLCLVFVAHTTAAVTINEGADPAVQRDIMDALDKLIPWNAGYRHMEGNSAAHIKVTLTGSSEQVIIEGGRLVLGTWQKLFLCEYDGPRTRKVHVKVMGDK